MNLFSKPLKISLNMAYLSSVQLYLSLIQVCIYSNESKRSSCIIEFNYLPKL